MIDDLIKEIEEDAASTLRRCVTYLNACSEEMTHGVPEIGRAFLKKIGPTLSLCSAFLTDY